MDAAPDVLTPEQAAKLGLVGPPAAAHDDLPDVITPEQAARAGLVEHPASTYNDSVAELRRMRDDLGPAVDASPLGLVKTAGAETVQGFKNIGHTLAGANDFAARSMFHPVDTFGGGNAPAVGREVLRGVNSNIPFANSAVEAAGGPAQYSPEDAARAPGAQAFGQVAGTAPVGKMVGGIVSRGGEELVRGFQGADRALGARALERATAPGAGIAGPVATKVGKYAGKAAGGVVGHGLGGFPGAAVGQHIGGKLGERAAGAIARGANAVDNLLAQRYLTREALESLAPTPPPAAAPVRLAPLVHDPLPSRFPEPAFDEISGEPLTRAGGVPETPPDLLSGPKTGANLLRANVVRDAGRFAAETPPAPGPSVTDTLGADLAKSVQLLDDLRAGKITAQVDAGLPSSIVARARR